MVSGLEAGDTGLGEAGAEAGAEAEAVVAGGEEGSTGFGLTSSSSAYVRVSGSHTRGWGGEGRRDQRLKCLL